MFTLTLDANLIQAAGYEPDESSSVGIMLDGQERVLNTIVGDGNGGPNISTGFQSYSVPFSTGAGDHTVVLFCRNSEKTVAVEVTSCVFDNVRID